MDSVASRLAELEVTSCEGQFVRIGDLWADAPAVLVFIRHFG